MNHDTKKTPKDFDRTGPFLMDNIIKSQRIVPLQSMTCQEEKKSYYYIMAADIYFKIVKDTTKTGCVVAVQDLGERESGLA